MKSFLKLSVLAIAITGIATSPVLAKRCKHMHNVCKKRSTAVDYLNSIEAEIIQFLSEMERILNILDFSDLTTEIYFASLAEQLIELSLNATEYNAKTVITTTIMLCEHMIAKCNAGVYGNMTKQEIKQMKQAMQTYNLDNYLKQMKKMVA